MNNKNAKKPSFNKIKSSKKRLVFAFLFLVIIGIFVSLIIPKESFIKTTVKKLFSGNTPISSVEIKTNDYDNEGSIKLTKEAHWISKTEAELDLKLETIRKTGDNKKDIVLVFDVSGSMEGEKLEKVKEDSSELINYVLDKDEDNRVGLITFASESRIISPLTNDKNSLLDTIEGMSVEDSTNYYLAYKSIEEILADYNKEAGKDLVVLFMTDGSPTENAGATKGVYESLKEQHPYMTLNSIEYEKGKTASDTQDISDGQWVADMNTLNNILFEATVSPEPYEKLKVIDYIDNEYFDIETNTPSKGNVVIDNNKITWRFTSNSYITGTEETLKVRLKLKNEYAEIKGLYPTNKKTEIEYKIEGEKEKSSTLTPILKNNYDVIYDINTPENCTLENPEGENHFIYDTVTIKNIEPKCTGYQLKGWQIEERDVKYKSEDKFIMPEHDVHIRAIWSRQTMKAYMDGTVHEKTTLYKTIESDDVKTGAAKLYTGEHQDSLTVPGTENIYYYNGNVTTNNVIFANFCWKIVRTTDTGGIKLIYNGVPINGVCNNTGTDAIVSLSNYNSNTDNLSHVGYMYNKPYNTKKVTPSTREYQVLRYLLNKTSYYSSEYDYNGIIPNRYILYDNPETNEDERFTSEQCVNDGNCSEVLKGTFTFTNTNPESTGYTLRYVVDVIGEYVYFIEIKNGQTVEDVNTMLYMGTGYTKNDDGSFTITNNDNNIEEFKKDEWIAKYNNAKNKYICEKSNPCDNPMFILGTNIQYHDTQRYSSNAIYANDVDYTFNEESNKYEYILKDTEVANRKELWEWSKDYNKVNYNHYTCFNTTGKCDEVYYLVTGSSSYYYYITLTNGEKIEDALNNMLYSDDVNVTNSVIKGIIDQWYETSMTNYTDYLEDSIYCNDRTIKDLAGFIPDGGDITKTLLFNASDNNRQTLKCENITDSFMVNNDKAKLIYPVGLLSADEANIGRGNVNNNYLAQSNTWWTMSPNGYGASCCGATGMSDLREAGKLGNGMVYADWLSNRYGVRPVVSLKPEIEYTDGDGTVNNPYIIDTSN